MKTQVILNCMVCGNNFEGEEPEMCCDGRDCGCMGLPVSPVVCSKECHDNLPNKHVRKFPLYPIGQYRVDMGWVLAFDEEGEFWKVRINDGIWRVHFANHLLSKQVKLISFIIIK